MRQTELKLSEEDRSVLEGIRSKGLHQAPPSSTVNDVSL
jgi:hypothetical protein